MRFSPRSSVTPETPVPRETSENGTCVKSDGRIGSPRSALSRFTARDRRKRRGESDVGTGHTWRTSLGRALWHQTLASGVHESTSAPYRASTSFFSARVCGAARDRLGAADWYRIRVIWLVYEVKWFFGDWCLFFLTCCDFIFRWCEGVCLIKGRVDLMIQGCYFVSPFCY